MESLASVSRGSESLPPNGGRLKATWESALSRPSSVLTTGRVASCRGDSCSSLSAALPSNRQLWDHIAPGGKGCRLSLQHLFAHCSATQTLYILDTMSSATKKQWHLSLSP
jgi:hypothetical protein